MRLRTTLPVAVSIGTVLGLVTAASITRPGPVLLPGLISEVNEVTLEAVRWDFPVTLNDAVESFVVLLTDRQPQRMATYLKRSGRYEGMIRSKLRARGMPEDLVFLAMVESGFNPLARSPAQAVGLWQFIPETGRRYGLRIDAYVDERRDPERSTDAALGYLSDLHDRFGSWYLAAAAYNTGENRIGRIMRETTGEERGRDDDFWRIRHRLPRETQSYVPMIIATSLVGKEPQRYGIDTGERYLSPPTELVEVPGGTDLGLVAAAVRIDRGDLRQLNPALLRGMVPPGLPYTVRVPAGRGALLIAALPTIPEASSTTYVVGRGDTLWSVARRHGVTVAALRRANGLRGTAMLQPGQVLQIPG